MGEGKPIAIGGVTGLVVGILVGIFTDIPFAPEGGVLLGALAGWLVVRQKRAS